MAARDAVILAPGAGRAHDLGDRVSAVFKADGDESLGRYSISEWWFEPHTRGPGAHTHHEDDLFFVLGGTMEIRVGDDWVHAPAGTFVLVPGGTVHTFENRTDERAGFLNVSAPGDFESHMPTIAAWFRDRAPADARC
jgi:mannose-6-phosphate isomerase-like protein (cupin superfamily)